MAAWPGRSLNCAASWGWHESRTDGAGTARLVCHAFTLVEGCEVNSTKGNGLTADNSQPAETYKQDTNDLNFATGTRRSKAESNLCAMLALAGHAVHSLKDGGYLVCKYGYTHHASDLEALKAFAVRLGVQS